MRGPLSAEEFATLVRVPLADLERYRGAGLVDPDGDRRFDEYDMLRLQYVLVMLDRGETLEEIARGVDEKQITMPFFRDLLFDFRGGSLPMTDASEKLGLSEEQIRALATAIGMPITRAFDEKDLHALEGAKMALAAGLPWSAIIEASRVFGDAFRRIAGTEARLVNEFILRPQAIADPVERTKQAYEVLEALGPIIEPLLGFIHRQYLLRAFVEDALQQFNADPTAREAAILFVDLSSFTTLTHEHGDEEAADVLARFEDLVRGAVLHHHGALVKQIGDEFMVIFDDPADAVRFAIDIDDRAAREERFPALRVGIHAGPVLYRVGDYIGTTVNIASRITTSAAASEILLSETVAAVAANADIAVEPLGVRMLRGVGDPIGLFRVVRARSAQRDPVCGMSVTDETAARLTWNGKEHAFCSQDCLRKFVESPERYS